MTIYMTKVWGLASPIGPLQFSTRGWRERARDMLRGGDYVILSALTVIRPQMT
jgi:hypothetical protein